MKTFKCFVEAADQTDDALETKKQLVNFIASNFFRFINSPDKADNKALLMLIGALSMLNTSDDPPALNVARRMAQAALTRSSKK